MQPSSGCKRERIDQEHDDSLVRRTTQKGVDSIGRRLQLVLDARNCHRAINALCLKYPELGELKKKFDIIAANGYLGEAVPSYILAARKSMALVYYRN